VATKDIVGFMLLCVASLMGAGLACLSRRAREAAFFFMVAGIVVSDRLDINFFTHFWYRGTTRGFEFSFVDILAFSVFVGSFLCPREGESRWRWPAGLGFMLVFILYAGVSTLASDPKVFGLFEFSKMLRGLMFFLAAFMFIRGDYELAIFVCALCCAACLEGVLSIRQRFMMGLDRVAGSLDHSNSLSIYLCLVGPIFVSALNSTIPGFLRWFSGIALAACALAIVLTVSRAGVPIFCLVVLGATLATISWQITPKKVIAVVLISIGVGGLSFKFWDDLKARYEESTLSDEYLNDKLVENRGYYLRLARVIVEDRFFGVGLNNWSYWVSKRYGAEINTPYSDYDDLPPGLTSDDDFASNFAAPAHNLAALTIGELGVPGLAIFLLLWLRWFQMGASFFWKRARAGTRRVGLGIFFGLIGIFLQSITEWSFRHTPIFLTVHVAVGVLASLYYLRREESVVVEAEESEEVLEYELAVEQTG
jgi:hypothetical protein